MRSLKGNPHGLFPVGAEGDRLKSFQAALLKGKISSKFALFCLLFEPRCLNGYFGKVVYSNEYIYKRKNNTCVKEKKQISKRRKGVSVKGI